MAEPEGRNGGRGSTYMLLEKLGYSQKLNFCNTLLNSALYLTDVPAPFKNNVIKGQLFYIQATVLSLHFIPIFGENITKVQIKTNF